MWNPPWIARALGDVSQGRLSDEELQDRLFRYFSTQVEDVDEAVMTGQFIPHRRAYMAKLKETNPELFADSARDECFNQPAWQAMKATRKMPPGQWLVHHTTRDVFRSFTYGTVYCGSFATVKKPVKDKADCAVNLTNAIPDDQRVFGFAYTVPLTEYGKQMRRSKGLWTPQDDQIENLRQVMDSRVGRSASYGRNAVYFKSNAAIEVYHTGDLDWQIIFPLCSEYDVFTSEDAKAFPDGVAGAMDYIDSGKGKFAGLSGLTRGPKFAFRGGVR